MKKIFFYAALCMSCISCNNAKTNAAQPAAEQNDTVMEFNVKNLEWTRSPKSCEITDDTIRITTAPGTDLWQRTYYHFRNDNAPVLQMTTRQRFF